MRRTTNWLWAAVALFSLPVLAAEPNPKDMEAIREKANKFAQAWNEGDAVKMAQHFAEDATFVDSSGERAASRMDIQRLLERQHQGNLKGSQITMTVTKVRMLPSQLAFVDVEQRIQMSMGQQPMGQQPIEQKPMAKKPADQQPMPKHESETIHITALLQKKVGQWVVLDARSTQFVQPQAPGVGGAGEQIAPEEPTVPSPLEPMTP